MPVPEAWRDEFPGKETVDLIPLVDGSDSGNSGWCTYDWGFDAPDVEVFCGGQNHKTVTAAAFWRQGFLVHFGFEESPAQLNDAGDAMLLAAIVYAARCKEDRPVTRMVSGFKTRKRFVLPREKGKAGLASEEGLQTWFDGHVVVELADLAEDARRKRFDEVLPFLVANGSSRFEVDAVLRAWGVGNRDPAFFARCEKALGAGGDDAAKARALLERYAPDGPGAGALAEAWTKWIAEHRDYVFFSDVGGFRWVVDPLAKTRGVPTARLRGAARVTAQ
ncbi:MAG TPA: hypothetical protein VFD82_12885 [Planctomycetota bacterium]|nr:hypothetical protein [Planctomycetota bacterium]